MNDIKIPCNIGDRFWTILDSNPKEIIELECVEIRIYILHQKNRSYDSCYAWFNSVETNRYNTTVDFENFHKELFDTKEKALSVLEAKDVEYYLDKLNNEFGDVKQYVFDKNYLIDFLSFGGFWTLKNSGYLKLYDKSDNFYILDLKRK